MSLAIHSDDGRMYRVVTVASAFRSQASSFSRLLCPLSVSHRPMPQPELLEAFPNPYPGRNYQIHMTTAEFTSLCPIGGIETDAAELALLKGGAPDFATIEITYIPGDLCLELKALKLYLWSFRNDGIFYERAVNRILDDLSEKSSPRWMRIVGDFNVRGGIKSVIAAEVGDPSLAMATMKT
jgi:7-cyano-7-deazaguanine reductase